MQLHFKQERRDVAFILEPQRPQPERLTQFIQKKETHSEAFIGSCLVKNKQNHWTQDANAACKKMENIVVNGSVHTALQATSNDLPANLRVNLLPRPV